MILVAGGTGSMGRELVRLLTAAGRPVRVLTRDPARAEELAAPLVEIAVGDVREPETLGAAMAGVRAVVSAVHGFAGPGGVTPASVDGDGNSHLMAAATTAGVEHFVLLSYADVSADHPMELCRMKFRAEQELRASGLSWTIVRCAAFMETWVALTGAPLLHDEKAMVFGRGRNPMNFVSAHDVAAYVEIALRDPSLRGSVLTVGGPENLTMRELVATFAELTGTQLRVRRFPRPMLRLGSHLLARRNPMLAGHMRGGVTVDTRDQRFDPSANLQAFPSVRLTTVKELIRRDYMKETAVGVAPAPAARA